ncbi:divergent PAP2 family protein [Paenibacillus filicis]|uniref:Divergent PAP2 family protein n=1 Tax=Paenibacillus filicis TaxID=669464 RepID=A0ABU9DQC4_9BACL
MLFLAPFLGWLCSGILKYILNFVKYGAKARSMVGNGGFPSTHTTVAVSTTAAIGFSSGIDSGLFALGVAFSFIIIIDATGIRKALGEHAKNLNHINSSSNVVFKTHRESQGHTRTEVLGGVGLGVIVGYMTSLFL